MATNTRETSTDEKSQTRGRKGRVTVPVGRVGRRLLSVNLRGEWRLGFVSFVTPVGVVDLVE